MEKTCVLQWTKLHRDAVEPKKGSKDAAGFDLASLKSLTILPHSHEVVETGIQINLPTTTYGRIASRSSWSIRGILIGGGCIDKDYTGGINVIMCNVTDKTIEVKKGDRIAQLICEKIEYPVLVEVEKIERITERDTGSFGSSN